MITWRMEVKDEAFTNLRDHPSVGQDYITPNDGVASLDSFSVDGAGNCLEAQFTASPKFVDIRPRDIVSLEVSEDNGSTWKPVYRGYVVTAGNPRSDDIQSYKLVGLRQRFFEITNTIVNVLEQDVADQAADVFAHLDTEGDWPAGVVNSVPTIPSTGFVNGIVHPAKESYGDTFKQIADAAGRFVVNVGDSYTYDGVTYNEGDTVLGVRFGVDASGNAFFRRPQGNAVTYAEGDDGIVANYVQVTGEEIFDVVELEYASEIAGKDKNIYLNFTVPDFFTIDLDDAIPIPLRRSFTFGDSNSRRVVKLQSPEALMNNDPVLVSSFNVTNPSGPITGGSAVFPDSTGFLEYKHAIAGTSNDRADGCIVKLTVTPTSGESRFTIDIGTTSNNLNFATFEELDFTRPLEIRYVALRASNFVEAANDSPFDNIVPLADMNGRNIEISNFQIFVPDVDVGGTKSEQFASGFVRDVQDNVAEVKSVGELGAVADRVNWTPSGESQVTVPVERIQYTLTTRDGLITTYELGQAYDAEALSQRKVLKDLAREAVSE